MLERTPEAALAKFQLDVESPAGTTVILAAGSGARLIVRTVAKGSESGRELPGGPDVVLLDDQVYSLLSPGGGPRDAGGPPAHGDLSPHGSPTGAQRPARAPGEGGATRTLVSGDLSATVVTDQAGRVVQVELPGQDIVVQRAE